jgi:hypothetical protein
MSDWTRRVRRPPVGPEALGRVRDAAEDLAENARYAPGKGRIVFHTVADCALVGTAVIGGALACVHLWKALVPRHSEKSSAPEKDGDNNENQRQSHPPRRSASR